MEKIHVLLGLSNHLLISAGVMQMYLSCEDIQPPPSPSTTCNWMTSSGLLRHTATPVTWMLSGCRSQYGQRLPCGQTQSSTVRVLVLLFAAETFSRVILLVNLEMIGLGLRRPLLLVLFRWWTLCAMSMSEIGISAPKTRNNLIHSSTVSSED